VIDPHEAAFIAQANVVDAELLRQADALGPSSAAPAPAGPSAGRPADGLSAGQPAGPAPIDYAGDAKLLVEFVYDGVTPVFPALAPIYVPEVRLRLADSIGRLMQKYELSLAGIFARWEPEIRFAMVALPLAVPTYQVIAEQRAADRAARAQVSRPHETQPNPNAPAST
jgi:hypothetical protein